MISRTDGPLAGRVAAVLESFKRHGISGEGLEQYGIVALEIPPDADFETIKRDLRAGEESGA